MYFSEMDQQGFGTDTARRQSQHLILLVTRTLTFHNTFLYSYLFNQYFHFSIHIILGGGGGGGGEGACPDLSTCFNTLGSFVCICDEGYLANGTICRGKVEIQKCSPIL